MNDLSAKPARLTPGLYLVSTPIGNLGDLSPRARDVLASVDAILCEDTRVTGKLLKFYDIKKPLTIYNDHTGDPDPAPVLTRLQQGQTLALVSDAGTPLVADPGYKLVRAAREAGLYVTTIPGANAVLSALQLSGLPSDRFMFLGFTPPKSAARKRFWRDVSDVQATLIAYETAPRLAASLADAADILGARPASVVREMTKLYEETRTGTLPELAAHYQTADTPKGEIVLVIGAGSTHADEPDLNALLKTALERVSLKEAVAQVAAQTGLPRKQVYAAALSLKQDA